MNGDVAALVVSLVMAAAFFLANLKSGQTWLRLLTIAGFLVFAAAASLVAFRVVWAVLS